MPEGIFIVLVSYCRLARRFGIPDHDRGLAVPRLVNVGLCKAFARDRSSLVYGGQSLLGSIVQKETLDKLCGSGPWAGSENSSCEASESIPQTSPRYL